MGHSNKLSQQSTLIVRSVTTAVFTAVSTAVLTAVLQLGRVSNRSQDKAPQQQHRKLDKAAWFAEQKNQFDALGSASQLVALTAAAVLTEALQLSRVPNRS